MNTSNFLENLAMILIDQAEKELQKEGTSEDVLSSQPKRLQKSRKVSISSKTYVRSQLKRNRQKSKQLLKKK